MQKIENESTPKIQKIENESAPEVQKIENEFAPEVQKIEYESAPEVQKSSFMSCQWEESLAKFPLSKEVKFNTKQPLKELIMLLLLNGKK